MLFFTPKALTYILKLSHKYQRWCWCWFFPAVKARFVIKAHRWSDFKTQKAVAPDVRASRNILTTIYRGISFFLLWSTILLWNDLSWCVLTCKHIKWVGKTFYWTKFVYTEGFRSLSCACLMNATAQLCVPFSRPMDIVDWSFRTWRMDTYDKSEVQTNSQKQLPFPTFTLPHGCAMCVQWSKYPAMRSLAFDRCKRSHST